MLLPLTVLDVEVWVKPPHVLVTNVTLYDELTSIGCWSSLYTCQRLTAGSNQTPTARLFVTSRYVTIKIDWSVSPIPIEEEDLLVSINQIMFLGPAEARDDTVAIDRIIGTLVRLVGGG